MSLTPASPQAPPSGYPPFTPPPCVVFLVGPSGDIELANLGGGTYSNPFSGGALVGDDTVCSLAEAQQIVNELIPVTGLKLSAVLPNMGQFSYVPAWSPGGVVFGTNPDQVCTYLMVDSADNVVAGNIEALRRQQNERGIGVPGHWTYAPLEAYPTGPKQLQWVWD